MYNFAYRLPVAVLVFTIVVSFYLPYSDFQMANNGFLFVSNAAKVHNVCQIASKFIKKVLYIKINGSTEGLLPMISRQITNVYTRATTHCYDLDVRLLFKQASGQNIRTSNPIDVILYDSDLEKDIEQLKKIVTIKNDSQIHCIGHVDALELGQGDAKQDAVKTYEYVALGGTFDRLHNGHKILLSQAALRATKHLTVGVCDVNMLENKKLSELIEPVEQRIKAVLNFLTDINPNLEYNVLPIQDIYGPTKDDPRFQLLVVSEETIRGAEKVNEKRRENGLSELETYVIGLAQDVPLQEEEETKVSSSNIRMRLLGTLLKPPVPNPNIPKWPYVIGLAGGIASGKTTITQKLQAKGAAIINCDTLAHDLYKPGMPLNQTLAEEFGRHIINDTGEVDRKQLGQIVFGNKEELEKLNRLVWPAVIEEASSRVKKLGDEGYRVVVMEAAVMVRARWFTRCHQLWAVIVPPKEAIKRLIERNGLTEEEARQRIEAQPSNLEQVAHANIVFSPFWSYNHTQTQIDRAWDNLQKYLQTRT